MAYLWNWSFVYFVYNYISLWSLTWDFLGFSSDKRRDNEKQNKNYCSHLKFFLIIARFNYCSFLSLRVLQWLIPIFIITLLFIRNNLKIMDTINRRFLPVISADTAYPGTQVIKLIIYPRFSLCSNQKSNLNYFSLFWNYALNVTLSILELTITKICLISCNVLLKILFYYFVIEELVDLLGSIMFDILRGSVLTISNKL